MINPLIEALTQPWALHEVTLAALRDIVIRHVGGVRLSETEIEAATRGRKPDGPSGLYVVDGVGVIPISGVIAKHSSLVGGASQPRGVGVDQIRNDLRAALANTNVHTILFDVDSPGGSALGIKGIAEEIVAARGQKPMIAFTDGMMASAAYWIGSAADRIVSVEDADVGSIGVYAVHYDYSVAYHEAGIKPTIFKAGTHKAAGHPDFPLTDAAAKLIQDHVNETMEWFRSAVSAQRGLSGERLDAVADGRVHRSAMAKNLGLIDAVSTRDALMAELAEGKSQSKGGREAMKSESTNSGSDAAQETAAGSTARPETAAAAHAAQPAQTAVTAPQLDQAAAERTRILAIQQTAYPGQEALVLKLINDGTSQAAAVQALKNDRLEYLERQQTKVADSTEMTSTVVTKKGSLEAYEAEWARDPKLQEKFDEEIGGAKAYALFKKAENEGRVTIVGSGVH